MLDQIKEAVEHIVAKAKEARADGTMTFQELLGLFLYACGEFVKLADALNAPGTDKKAAVLAAVEKFIDEVVTPFDIPKVPNMVEPFVDQGVKAFLMYLADAAVEAAVKALPKASGAAA